MVEGKQFVHDFIGTFAVECAGRLVCKNHLRIVYHTAADAGSLQLSAGYLIDIVAADIVNAQSVHECPSTLLDLLSCFGVLLGFHRRENDIIQYRKIFHHVHLLKDKSHFIQAESCKLLVTAFSDLSAVKKDIACCYSVHARNAVEKCAFARTGRSHNCYYFALVDGQVNVFQDVVLALVYNVRFAKSFCL